MLKKRNVENCKKLYGKGRFIEAYIHSYLLLIKEFGYDKDETIIELIKADALYLIAILTGMTNNREWIIVARKLLEIAYGEEAIDELVEKLAVVTSREDRLVKKWRKKCLSRDNHKCVKCSSEESLCVHHISYWSNDPTNRVNVDNGITLCKQCHRKEHEADWFSNFV